MSLALSNRPTADTRARAYDVRTRLEGLHHHVVEVGGHVGEYVGLVPDDSHWRRCAQGGAAQPAPFGGCRCSEGWLVGLVLSVG